MRTLEKINPRQPSKVRKDYKHRLGGDTYRSDLQWSIFQSITSMLEDLDKMASIRALTTQVKFDAFNPTVFPDGRRNRGRGGSGGGRGRAAPRGCRSQGGRRTERLWYEKFCKICQMAGKAVHVHTSHNTVDCKPLYTSL